MSKLSYPDLLAKLHDPDIPEKELRQYLKADTRGGPFAPVVVPNEETVSVSQDEMEAASAMAFGNGLARWRRNRRFQKRRAGGERLPVLVSEGDSWFQFPFLIDDVVDQLDSRYLIKSLGAAGDTLSNMLAQQEYLGALRELQGDVRAFMLSAAGNDVIGADANNVSALSKILRFGGSGNDPLEHINRDVFANVLGDVTDGYRAVIRSIRAEPGLKTLPILIHGYDYPFPYPFIDGGTPDPRAMVIYAARDQWLGSAFKSKDIADPGLRREILRFLIDALYDTLQAIARTDSNVHVVNCRGTLTEPSDWNDEIHGTDAGFDKIAAMFERTLERLAPMV
ncbi:MAG: hypothetical protein NXH91_03430 [Phyllobacteriaceae bacterium]|nr:hypothetical protein [Phyllobacteriaceae bacterium]